MLNFSCVADSEDLSGVTDEVDHAEWYERSETPQAIAQNSLAQQFLLACLNRKA